MDVILPEGEALSPALIAELIELGSHEVLLVDLDAG